MIEQIPLKNVHVSNSQVSDTKDTKTAKERKLTTKERSVLTKDISRGSELPCREEDVQLLAKIIYAEARGESFEGQVAVGAVVLNRVESPQFPDTIREVIYQPGQFSAVDDRQIELTPGDQAYQAALAALRGEDPSNGAIFYYNPKTANDNWIRTRDVVTSIGNHNFSV